MFAAIQQYCDGLAIEFNSIPTDRKKVLEKISEYIQSKHYNKLPVNLVYICTHNSRRSFFGHIWSKVAADFYKIPQVNSFSGGTEATTFNINAIHALENIGFEIYVLQKEKNPKYLVRFDDDKEIECFSKKFDDPVNPKRDFAAIMTCSEADQNCPLIPAAEIRIATPYEDPKAFDGLPQQDSEYTKRCREVAIETLYVFSQVPKNIK